MSTTFLPPSRPGVDRIHVLIAGGGVGGLALAQGLKRAGVSFSVYERDRTPDARSQGFRLNFTPTGSAALHECLPPTLWEILVATAGDPGRGIGFLDEKFRELVLVGQDQPPLHPIVGEHAVSRFTLRQLLLAGLQDEVRFDKEFARYSRSPDGKITAHFSDGTTVTGDLLVGADGMRSRVRAQLLPDAGITELPAVAVGGKLVLTEQNLRWLPHRLISGRNVFWPRTDFLFTAIFRRREDPAQVASRYEEQLRAIGLDPTLVLEESRDNDYILWAFIAHRDAMPAGFAALSPQAAHDVLTKRTAGWHPDLRRLIAESDPGMFHQVEFTAAAAVQPWETTNVTVLGDALHHMPPVGGLGGNAALWDANQLRKALIRVDRGETALIPAVRAYEAAMIKHGFQTVNEAVDNTRGAVSRNVLRREASKAFFRLCGAVPALRRKVFEGGGYGAEPEAPEENPVLVRVR